MKPALLALLLLWQSAPPPNSSTPQQYLRYQRAVTPSYPGPSCAVLDPQLFPHAAPSLKDLRLYDGDREIPYALLLSEPRQPDSDTAQIRNLSLRGRRIVFDLEMPKRPYTEIVLDLAGKDFLATATVSGTRDPNYTHQIHLGDFTLFDLTSQHLSRSTTLSLQETDLPFLHIELAITPAAGATPLDPQTLLKMVHSATVPPSREAQSLYTTALTSTQITERDHQSITTFTLPPRIPVERVSFDLAPNFKRNFSRDVRIIGRPTNSGSAESETLTGTILRVHLTQPGREIHEQQLSVPATLGSNMQAPATVQISVENGDDAPLPITAVRLESRQRKLCFDAPSSASLTLFYGDAALPAPRYEYARLFSTSAIFHAAKLGNEQLNQNYRARPDARPFTERHPNLLWICLVGVIAILGLVAFRSSKTIHN